MFGYPGETLSLVFDIIKNERLRLTISLNTEKRVENTTRSGVFLKNVEVFENVVEYYFEYLICRK